MADNNTVDNNVSEQILKIKSMKRPTKASEIVSNLKEYKTAMKELYANYKPINDDDPKNIDKLRKSGFVAKNKIIKDVQSKKYNYHKIYNETYYPVITGFDNNLNDKYFPLRYNSTRTPIFNDNNVYSTEDADGNTIYGNIFINLRGHNHSYQDEEGTNYGDFEIADYWANEIGLFSGDRPEGYVWHHVFMNWFNNSELNYRIEYDDDCGDGMSMDNFFYNTRQPMFYGIQQSMPNEGYGSYYTFESGEPFYYYDKEIGKIQTLNASTWINCLTKLYYYNFHKYWMPDFDLSLMQLVKKESILGSEYLDSCDQYVIYCDNAYGGYQGDYTEDDHEKFRD